MRPAGIGRGISTADAGFIGPIPTIAGITAIITAAAITGAGEAGAVTEVGGGAGAIVSVSERPHDATVMTMRREAVGGGVAA
jgi:hypothetical protein